MILYRKFQAITPVYPGIPGKLQKNPGIYGYTGQAAKKPGDLWVYRESCRKPWVFMGIPGVTENPKPFPWFHDFIITTGKKDKADD